MIRRREAEEALRRVKRDSETIGSSTLTRHEPVATDADDAIELWGKRIGRGLGGVAIVVLVWELVRTVMAG